MKTIDELRAMTAEELLQLWRRCRKQTEDPLERTLLCNAEILAASCFYRGEAVYTDALAVLADLTPRRMERLLRDLAEGRGTGPAAMNPAFDESRFEALREE